MSCEYCWRFTCACGYEGYRPKGKCTCPWCWGKKPWFARPVHHKLSTCCPTPEGRAARRLSLGL